MWPVRAAPRMAWMAFSLHLVADDELQLDLGQQVDGVFAAAVELRVALLTAVAAGFRDGDSLDAGFDEGFFDRIQLGGLDHGFNLEHCEFLVFAKRVWAKAPPG